MPVYSFSLPITTGAQPVFLREMNGGDELLCDEPGSLGVLSLLNRVMTPPDKSGNTIRAEKIVIAERDFILSVIYKVTYGSRIQSTLHCQSCKSTFDLDFSLEEWVKHTRQHIESSDPDTEGYFHLGDNGRFRLPNGEDEIAVWGLPAEQAEKTLLSRCIPELVSPSSAAAIQQSMEKLAPPLFADMETQCPECGHQQTAHFDMQTFFLARMRNERKRVAAEVHCIATTYKWSHKEILELPRSVRKMYAALIGLE